MKTRTLLMAAAALAAGAGLAACERAQPQVAALPLDTGAAAPLGEAPAPGGLPPAPPAQFAALSDDADAYGYPDRAWGMSWAFGDSPPDYAFYDNGVTPWVWVADDDSECLAEPVPGGERYYYFEPGAYTPFYVQDPSYGYGFANGQLAAIYDRGGRRVAPGADPAAAATAGQYLARGRLLRQAAASQPHQPVAAANWNARRSLIGAEHASFARDAARDPAWLAYHQQHQAQDQARFAPEATRREAWAAQTDTRLGDHARAQREQRLAQAISQRGVEAGPAGVRAPPAAPPPSQALERYAAATPGRAAPDRAALGRVASVRAASAHAASVSPAPGRGFERRANPPVQAERQAPAEHPQVARAAVEHGSDTAYQARAPGEAHAAAAQAQARVQAQAQSQSRAAFAERRAAQPAAQAAPPHVFHAPPSPPPAVHAAPAPHAAAAPAPPQPAPQAHPAPPAHPAAPAQHGGGNGDDKHH